MWPSLVAKMQKATIHEGSPSVSTPATDPDSDSDMNHEPAQGAASDSDSETEPITDRDLAPREAHVRQAFEMAVSDLARQGLMAGLASVELGDLMESGLRLVCLPDC